MSENEILIDAAFISPIQGTGKILNKFETEDPTTTILKLSTISKGPLPMNLRSILISKPMIEKTEKQIMVNINQILEAKN